MDVGDDDKYMSADAAHAVFVITFSAVKMYVMHSRRAT